MRSIECAFADDSERPLTAPADHSSSHCVAFHRNYQLAIMAKKPCWIIVRLLNFKVFIDLEM